MMVPNRNPRLTNEHAWPDSARSWKAFDGGTGKQALPFAFFTTSRFAGDDYCVAAPGQDPHGFTARFTLNLLHVLNRELGADFDIDAFDHIAFWDPVHERMDLRLRVNDDQVVTLPGAHMRLELNEGEEIRVEISTTFRVPHLIEELANAGFDTRSIWTDEAGDVALLLADVTGAGAAGQTT